MGTNYYLRNRIPNNIKERIKEYTNKDMIDSLKDIVNTYCNVPRESYDVKYGGYHLGKKSGGWKFLWNPNMWVRDNGHYDHDNKKWVSGPTLIKTYELSKEGITGWLNKQIANGSIIVSEYYDEEHPNEEVYTLEQFLDIAFNSDGLTSETSSYRSLDPVSREWNNKFRQYGYAAKMDVYSDFIRDGLRFATFTEFS